MATHIIFDLPDTEVAPENEKPQQEAFHEIIIKYNGMSTKEIKLPTFNFKRIFSAHLKLLLWHKQALRRAK